MNAATARRWVLAITSASALLDGLDALVVSTAITTIRSDLAATPEQLGWMVNAYTLVFAVLLMPASALGDRFGRRRVFTSGVLLFTAASAACALATDPSVLIAARAVQGAGSAAIMPLALALLTAAFPPQERAGALGVFAATTGISVPLGPLVGGAVVHGISWPWIFWLNVPLGLALALAARLRLTVSGTPSSTSTGTPSGTPSGTAATSARIDVVGILLVAVGAFGVVWALVRADGSGWTSPGILAALAVGLAGLAAFVAWEGRTGTPMLPLSLFRTPGFAAGGVTIFFLWGSALGSVYFMAQFFQTGQGLDALSTGVRMIAWGATTTFVPRLVGRRIPARGAPVFIAGGMGLHALGLLWFASAADPGRGYGWLVAPLVLSGTGCATAIPAAQALTLASLQGPRIGTAAGAFSMFRQLGGAAGVAAMIAAFGGSGGYGDRRSFTDGFVAALVVGAAFAAVAGAAGGGPLLRLLARTGGRAPADEAPARPAEQSVDAGATSSGAARGLHRQGS